MKIDVNSYAREMLALDALAKLLTLALRDLSTEAQGERCWCEFAIGNPMYPTHTAACLQARRALAEAEQER